MGIAAAFAGAALAIPASADVSVSGFMNQRIGFGDYRDGKESDDSIHFRTDAEVLFTGTGTTDGGLKVTARVELEGDSGGDQIDENWLSVEGDFGKVTLGGEDAAVITHGYVGIGSGFGNIGYYDSGDTWTPVGSDIAPVGYSDGQGIRYSTPSVGGFSGAISFQPEGKDGAGSSETSADNDHSIISVAGSYSTNVGAMSLTIGGGILSRADNPDGHTFVDTRVTQAPAVDHDNNSATPNLTGVDAAVHAAKVASDEFGVAIDRHLLDEHLGSPADVAAAAMPDEPLGKAIAALRAVNKDNKLGNHWGVGASLGFGANTLHLRMDVREDEAGEGLDQTDWGIQLQRSAGGTTFGIGYAESTTDAESGPDTKKSKVVAGANYSLGGGTTVGAGVAWGEVDNPTGADLDGTSFGAHIAFSF